jgi:hypothetical protein
MHYSVPRTTLPVHGTTRYMRAHLEVNDGVLRWEVPRTLLGIVAIGSTIVEVPIAQVASIRMRRTAPHPVRSSLGVTLAIAPWFLLSWWLSLPLSILGLWVVITTLGPHLEIVTVAGRVHRSPVCPGHSIDAELYVAAVEDMVAGST